jgi:soluble lytic murein transglycosylase-like protein
MDRRRIAAVHRYGETRWAMSDDGACPDDRAGVDDRAGPEPTGNGRTGWRWAARAAAVPLAVAVAASSGAPAVIRIRAGDSLWALAARYGTTVAALKRLNHLPGDTIYAGRTLLVPGHGPAPRAAAGRGVRYRVRAGDTVTRIAVRYRVGVGATLAVNHLDRRGMIRVGQLLVIPVRVSRPAAHRPAAGPPARQYPPAVGALAARHRRLLAARSTPSRLAVRLMIRGTARALGVDPALALAVAQQESGFRQDVVSPADAIGVMQVLPSTGRWVGRALLGRPLDLLDPADNVLAGVSLLATLTRAAPLPTAVAGYYQGLASVRRHGMLPDTRRYVANVLALRHHWT